MHIPAEQTPLPLRASTLSQLAIMATLAPESRGAAMSIMNLGSGLSTFIGLATAGLFLPVLGVSGVIWIFACMYLTAAVISYTFLESGLCARVSDSMRFTCEFIVSWLDFSVDPLAVSQAISRMRPACS